MVKASDQSGGRLAEGEIKAVDALYLTAEERAENVMALLKEVKHYDITAFACQWLGLIHLQDVEGDDVLKSLAVTANLWFNHNHYNGVMKVMAPDRDLEEDDCGPREENETLKEDSFDLVDAVRRKLDEGVQDGERGEVEVHSRGVAERHMPGLRLERGSLEDWPARPEDAVDDGDA